MTRFIKAFIFCTTAILAGFILQVLAGTNSTLFECKRECKAQPDDYVCGQAFHRERGEPNGKLIPYYKWLRNECERACFRDGDFKKVDMDHCTKDGQNYTTYMCDYYKVRQSSFQKCMRNESLY